MFRRIGSILTVIGFASLVWLIISWVSEQPISSLAFIGVLIGVLGLLLTRKPTAEASTTEISPSRRKSRESKHRSWVNGGEE